MFNDHPTSLKLTDIINTLYKPEARTTSWSEKLLYKNFADLFSNLAKTFLVQWTKEVSGIF